MAKSKLDKIKDIKKAFTEPLPIGQDWYEKRLAICKTCPKNTENIHPKDYTFSDKAKIGLRLCDEGNHCTACGCCIERKSALKTNVCGLEDIGEKPLWGALEVKNGIDKGLSIINLTPTQGNISTGTSEFIYDIGETTEQKVSLKFQLRRDNGLKVKTFSVGCSCTVGNVSEINSKTSEFSIGISTVNFWKGVTSKKMKVLYIVGNTEKEIHITFKINKTNGK